MRDITLLPSAKVPLIYAGESTMTTEWYRFFWNIYGFTATGVVPVDKGGTGLDSIGDHQFLMGNASNAFERVNFAGAGINITYSSGLVTWSIGASGVTPGTYGTQSAVGQFTINEYGVITFAQNVAIKIDASQIISGTIDPARISGSYTGITGVGTLTAGTWAANTIGTAYGGTGLTSFTSGGALYATSSSTLTSGTLPVASGGTGQTTYTNGQLLIGNSTGNTLTKATLTAGAGVSITNGAGSITISATGSGGDVVGPSSATDNAIARYDGTTGKLIQNSAVNISDAGDIANAGSIAFDGTNPPTPAPGTFWFESSTNTWNAQQNAITQQIGEEIFVYGKASNTITGETLLQAIVKTGTVGSSGVIQFGVAGAGITDAGVFIGVATENIATNGFGRITNFGVVHGINTSGSTYGETWADNDDIWYNPTTGGLTKTKPTAPNIKMKLGTVINAGPGGSGSFQVFLEYGSTLGGTDSNVNIVSASNGQILTYDGSATYWKNTTLTAGSGVSISASSGGVLTISATGSGGTVTSVTGTAPISVATGTTTPVISISQATTSTNGYLSSTDWNTFNNKANAFTYTNHYIPYGQGTTTPNQSSLLQFDGTTLGVGGTLSAWSGAGYVLQIGQGSIFGGTTAFHVAENTYYDGAAYRYIANGYATDHYQLNGTFVWRNVASGTAGATISWTNGMVLDASNNLTITGTATANGVLLTGNTGTVTSVAALTIGTSGTDLSSTVANSTTTPVITLNVPTASATNRGALSAADWSTFNGKANAFTYTTNYIPYGQGTTTPNQSSSLQYNGLTFSVGGAASNWDATVGSVVQTNGPSLWGSSAVSHVSHNTYYLYPNYYYINTGYVTDYYQLNGTHVWRSAASASAGSSVAGWTTQMTLDASGNITNSTWTANTIAAAYGGTGQSTYAVGDILYASTTSALSRLADVATGNALISGGVNTAPSWGKIGLTTHVSGTLAVGNGGTGASSASITAFNNITGYSAAGATGTTSTNLVFSAVPTFGTTIGVGNATAAASGAGVSFPASQSASSDVNTLDDYKEGTFTPSVTPTSGSITSFGTLSGKYTKIGNFVSASVSIAITNNGTGAGYLKVSNMPYTCGTLDGNGSGRESQSAGWGLLGRIDAGTTNLYIQRYDGNYPAGTNYTVNFTVNYLV